MKNLEEGIPYKIKYKNSPMEGIYVGSIKKGERALILLNICPEAPELPLHFPLISIKAPELKEGEIVYEGYVKKIGFNGSKEGVFKKVGEMIWGQDL